MLVDYHVHSEFSNDSIYDMEECVIHAIDINLDEICFTDHVDYGVKKDWEEGNIIYSTNEKAYVKNAPLANVDYEQYFKKINYLKNKYTDKIIIKTGLEFGMQTHTVDKFQKLYNRYLFDFIILSCHQIDDKGIWTGDFQKGKTRKQYYERYYQEILNVIKQYKDYSVLGHLDLIVRYDKLGPLPFAEIKDIVTEILKTVITDNKGIELNTSYHRYNLSDSQPSKEILKLYKELGGKIITIGSDSHKEEHLGAYIKEGFNLLKEIGFEYYCTYDNMKPIFHKI